MGSIKIFHNWNHIKTYQYYFIAKYLFFMVHCIFLNYELVTQHRYEHVTCYRVLKSYCFSIQKIHFRYKKTYCATLKPTAGKQLFASIVFDIFNFEYFILKLQTISPPSALPKRITEPLQKPCLLAAILRACARWHRICKKKTQTVFRLLNQTFPRHEHTNSGGCHAASWKKRF